MEASPFTLKVRLLKAEVLETLLYGKNNERLTRR